MAIKSRIRVPIDIEAEVLFKADHTCSICHDIRVGVQIAHLDDNPSNNVEENLIALCPNCHSKIHNKSTITKGFTLAELIKYKTDWEDVIKKRRENLRYPSEARLVRFDGPDVNTVYLETLGGVLRSFQDPLTFELLGFNWGNVDIYPEGQRGMFRFDIPLRRIEDSNKIRLQFSNGTLANEVYIIWEDGRKHHIPDPETLNEIGGFSDIKNLDYLEFNSIPHGKPLENIFTIRTNRILRGAMEKAN
jgi:hypothetical protein